MPPKLVIAPRRSMTFFALLAMAMVIASYVFVILLAAACAYLPYLLLTSVQSFQLQVLLLFLGGIVIAGAMLWSILPRRHKFEVPGPLLQRESHPRLFAEIDSIAKILDEPIPWEVYLIDQVNAFVSDRRGIFGSRRTMAIGLPLLSILSVSEFRAILAHEFAHYYSGDTKLGPFVYKAQLAMIRTLRNIGSIEAISRIQIVRVLYLLVTLVLQHFFTLFLRVTNFVSRKKEYRADELACLVAGIAPFRRGLQKIHTSDLAWAVYWGTEIEPLLNQSYVAAIAEGFAKFLEDSDLATHLTQSLEKETEQSKTTPFDTHPPLRDRIAAIERLRVLQTDEDSSPAISLLDSLDLAELQLIAFANPKLDPKSLQRVNWDHVGPIVMIPAWKTMVSKHGSLLQSVTVRALPGLAAKIRELGSRMPDPPGILLGPHQRTQRATQLLSSALALALLDNGWRLETKPGVFYFHFGAVRENSFEMVNGLVRGNTTAEAWVDKCTKLGIADTLLVPTALTPAD